MQLEIFAFTNDGCVRPHNEDNFTFIAQGWSAQNKKINLAERGALLMVADGMGGTNAGEVASKIAVTIVENRFNELKLIPQSDEDRKRLLKDLIMQAHNEIVREGKVNPESAGMGTTSIIAWLIDDNAYIAWSGDSRCYVYRQGQPFYPITNDHSVVWEQVVKGNMNAEQARLHDDSNIILQSLGDSSQPPKPDTLVYPLQKGDRLFLCSDGLNSMLSDNEIEQIVSNNSNDVVLLCRKLIDAANNAGGHDNITVIAADVKEGLNKAPTFHHNQVDKQKVSSKKIAILSGLILVSLGVLAYLFRDSLLGKSSPTVVEQTDTTTNKVKDAGAINYTKQADTLPKKNNNTEPKITKKEIKEVKKSIEPTIKKEQAPTIEAEIFSNKKKIIDLLTLKDDLYGNTVEKLKNSKDNDSQKVIKLSTERYNDIITTFNEHGYKINADGKSVEIDNSKLKPILPKTFVEVEKRIKTTYAAIQNIIQ